MTQRKSSYVPNPSIAFLRTPSPSSLTDVLPSYASLMVPFDELTKHQCHFPTGNAWCGQQCAAGWSYCADHVVRVCAVKK